jgi:hypothetical protein
VYRLRYGRFALAVDGLVIYPRAHNKKHKPVIGATQAGLDEKVLRKLFHGVTPLSLPSRPLLGEGRLHLPERRVLGGHDIEHHRLLRPTDAVEGLRQLGE